VSPKPTSGRPWWLERLGDRWRRLPKPALVRRLISEQATKAMVAAINSAPLPERRPMADLDPGPLLLSGFFGEVLGVGSAARLTAGGLRQAGLSPILDDLAPQLELPLYARRDFPLGEPGGVWISHCNAPELKRMVYMYPNGALSARYRIGYWAYELEQLPLDWRPTARALHEIWTPSRFVVDAVRRSIGDDIPITIMPHPTADLSHIRADRARFGVKPDAFVVLVLFDLRSTRARKNPDAAVEAYLQAFPEPSGAAMLVCKVTASDKAPAEFAKLQQRIGARRDILLLTDRLDDDGVWSLIASADVLLSLHRAEGYGLVLAEAMKLGRCVVATGWSGNMDFMNAGNAVPIPFRRIQVKDPQKQYLAPDQTWADADVGAAADALLRLKADPVERRRLGDRALQTLTRHEAGFAAVLASAPWRRLAAP
jgi:glycosyltransferase involved in cell wall biosynthesis